VSNNSDYLFIKHNSLNEIHLAMKKVNKKYLNNYFLFITKVGDYFIDELLVWA
jgi:hypothetical protein